MSLQCKCKPSTGDRYVGGPCIHDRPCLKSLMQEKKMNLSHHSVSEKNVPFFKKKQNPLVKLGMQQYSKHELLVSVPKYLLQCSSSRITLPMEEDALGLLWGRLTQIYITWHLTKAAILRFLTFCCTASSISYRNNPIYNHIKLQFSDKQLNTRCASSYILSMIFMMYFVYVYHFKIV